MSRLYFKMLKHIVCWAFNSKLYSVVSLFMIFFLNETNGNRATSFFKFKLTPYLKLDGSLLEEEGGGGVKQGIIRLLTFDLTLSSGKELQIRKILNGLEIIFFTTSRVFSKSGRSWRFLFIDMLSIKTTLLLK